METNTEVTNVVAHKTTGQVLVDALNAYVKSQISSQLSEGRITEIVTDSLDSMIDFESRIREVLDDTNILENAVENAVDRRLDDIDFVVRRDVNDIVTEDFSFVEKDEVEDMLENFVENDEVKNFVADYCSEERFIDEDDVKDLIETKIKESSISQNEIVEAMQKFLSSGVKLLETFGGKSEA